MGLERRVLMTVSDCKTRSCISFCRPALSRSEFLCFDGKCSFISGAVIAILVQERHLSVYRMTQSLAFKILHAFQKKINAAGIMLAPQLQI